MSPAGVYCRHLSQILWQDLRLYCFYSSKPYLYLNICCTLLHTCLFQTQINICVSILGCLHFVFLWKPVLWWSHIFPWQIKASVNPSFQLWVFFFFLLLWCIVSKCLEEINCKSFYKWHHTHYISVHTSPSVSVYGTDRNRNRQSRQWTTLSANIDPQTVKHMSYYSYALLFSLLPLSLFPLLLSTTSIDSCRWLHSSDHMIFFFIGCSTSLSAPRA